MITLMQVTMKNTFPYSSKACIGSATTLRFWLAIWWLVMVVLPTLGGSAMLYLANTRAAANAADAAVANAAAADAADAAAVADATAAYAAAYAAAAVDNAAAAVAAKSCQLLDMCVASSGYPNQNYGNYQSCSINFAPSSGPTTIEVIGTFITESTSYDYITVDGQRYGGTNPSGLDGLRTTDKSIDWRTDSSGTYSGWKLCFSNRPTFRTTSTAYVPSSYTAYVRIPTDYTDEFIAFGILMLAFALFNAFSRFSIYGVHYFWIFWKYPAWPSNDVDEEAGCCKCWPWCPTLSQPYHGFRDCCCAECSWVCTSIEISVDHKSSDTSDFTPHSRGVMSKIGLFLISSISLAGVASIAHFAEPKYVDDVNMGEAGTATSDIYLQQMHKENERNAITRFGIIGGAITAGLVLHYGINPGTRDYELYLLVLGGLLDATTDILYMMMEAFDSTTILFELSAAIIVLPLAMVALAFWPLMAIEYKSQKWRYILLPVEGVLLLLVLPFTATAYIVPAIAADVTGRSKDAVASVASYAYGASASVCNKMYVEITEQIVEKRVEGIKKTVKKKLKFYHRGLFEAILAFFLAPVGIVIVVTFGVAITIIVVILAIVVVVVGIGLAFVLSFTAPMTIAVVFSVMAFLRLFFLFPSVWEELYHLAFVFAELARESVPVDDFMDEDRLIQAKGQVFKLYDQDSAEGAKSDMKDSTIKYLFVEFLLEALPQLIIQGLNNKQTQNWSNLSIISMTISGIIILNSAIKYGSLYCLVPEEEIVYSF